MIHNMLYICMYVCVTVWEYMCLCTNINKYRLMEKKKKKDKNKDKKSDETKNRQLVKHPDE